MRVVYSKNRCWTYALHGGKAISVFDDVFQSDEVTLAYDTDRNLIDLPERSQAAALSR